MSRAAAFAALIVVALGCRAHLTGTALPPDDPRPSALLRGLGELAETRHSLRGEAKLSVDAPDLRFRSPQRFALRRPARLRVEVLRPLLHQVEAVLVTDGATYQLFQSAARELEEGPVTPGLLWSVARLDLSPEEAVEILLGAPRPAAALAYSGAEGFEDGRVALDFSDSRETVRQRFAFDALGRLLSVADRGSSGESVSLVRFDDYRKIGAADFAFSIALEFTQLEASARVTFKRVELDPALSDALFVLAAPERVSSRAGDGAP